MSSATAALHRPETQRLLWRGAIHELLALAFSYPDQETMADLGACFDAIAEHKLAAIASTSPAFDALAAAFGNAEAGELAASHNALFAGEVLCSPCETEYEFDSFAKARQLADIAGFYRAFGLKVASAAPAPADFIATEFEFMSGLVMRQAYAAVNGWDEKRLVCEDAQRTFLEDHLGGWTPQFCRALLELEETGEFYAAAAALCHQFVSEEVEATGARPRPAAGRRGANCDAEEFTCMFAPARAGDEEEPL